LLGGIAHFAASDDLPIITCGTVSAMHRAEVHTARATAIL